MVSFPQVSLPKPCAHLPPPHATCPTHLILLDRADITYTIYYTLSQNVCMILHREYNHKKPVTVDSLQTEI